MGAIPPAPLAMEPPPTCGRGARLAGSALVAWFTRPRTIGPALPSRLSLSGQWRIRPGDGENGRSVKRRAPSAGYRYRMRKTEALVEHMSEEHVMAIPDDVRHLPPEQPEIVMAARHGMFTTGSASRCA
jgi:hypothetical protein